MQLDELDHIGLAVADVARSIRWYQGVLGLQRAFEADWHDYPAVLVAGHTGVALFPSRGAPIRAANSFDDLVHVGFRTTQAGFDAARKQLTEQRIEFRERDHGISRSLYLLDPDGYLLEVTCYEAFDAGPRVDSAPMLPPTMQGDDLLQLSDLNLAEFYRDLIRRSPGGVVQEEDGLLLYSGAHPTPVIVNGAIRTRHQLAADEALDRAERFFAERRHGFCFSTAAHADTDIEEAAGRRGYRVAIDLSAMVLDHRLEERPFPAGSELRWVEDAAGVRDFAEVISEAFDPDMARVTLTEPRILVGPHLAAAVGYLDGRPASAAMTAVSYGVALVGFVGTKAEARRRGLGEAMTRAITNRGFDLGATMASLQASPQGDAIYRRLGYREISRYREWLAPA